MAGKFYARFNQRHCPQMIGLGMANSVRRHIGQHEVCRATKLFLKPSGGGIIHKIHLGNDHPFDGIDWQQINPHYHCQGATPPHHLRPSAGCNAQINHPFHAFEERKSLIQFEQLEGSAAAIAFGFGLLDVGIIQLSREPAV